MTLLLKKETASNENENTINSMKNTATFQYLIPGKKKNSHHSSSMSNKVS